MAVYCESLSDRELIAELGNSRNVLIVGCPSCPAIRYALDGDSPVVAVTITGIRSTGVESEVDRLTRLLTGKKLHVESWILRIPQHLCEVDRDGLRRASRRFQAVDAVIVLGCEAGKENVEESFPDARTICAMNAKGLISFPAVRKINKILPDRKAVSIYPFQLLPE